MVHDGFTVHPGIVDCPELVDLIKAITGELRICCREHRADERLARVEASLRWLIGERV